MLTYIKPATKVAPLADNIQVVINRGGPEFDILGATIHYTGYECSVDEDNHIIERLPGVTKANGNLIHASSILGPEKLQTLISILTEYYVYLAENGDPIITQEEIEPVIDPHVQEEIDPIN